MQPDDRLQGSDDIAQLKERLGDDGLRYHDITRDAELRAVCRRWPLVAESERLLGHAAADSDGIFPT